jgi:hypothetical protein
MTQLGAFHRHHIQILRRSFGAVVVAGCFREEQKGRTKKLNANGRTPEMRTLELT